MKTNEKRLRFTRPSCASSLCSALCALCLLAIMLFALAVPAIAETYETVPDVKQLSINTFTFTPPAQGKSELEVKFQVSGGEGWFDYEIYAAVAENGTVTGKRLLRDGEAKLDEMQTVTCSLESLNSYGSYSLYLAVYKMYDVIEVSADRLADGTFSYTSDNMMPAPNGFDVTINLTDHTVLCDWSDFTEQSGDGWIFAMDDGSADVFYQELGRDATSASVFFNQKAQQIVVDLSYRRNGRVSQAYSRRITISDILTFDFGAASNVRQGKISYQTDKDAIAEVYVTTQEEQYAADASQDSYYNDDDSDESKTANRIKLSGKDFISITLDEYTNDVNVFYTFDDLSSEAVKKSGETWFCKNTSVYLDLIAPTLTLPEHDTDIFTSEDTFDIIGLTETGCTVTINDADVSLNDNGGFQHTVKLKDGENLFTIHCVDAAGNATAQTIRIYKTNAAGSVVAKTGLFGKYLWLICAAGVALLLAAVFFLFFLLYQKQKQPLSRRKKMRSHASANTVAETELFSSDNDDHTATRAFADASIQNHRRKSIALFDLIRNIVTVPFALSLGLYGYALWHRIALSRYINSDAFPQDGLADTAKMYDRVNEYLRAVSFSKLILIILCITGALFAVALILSILIRKHRFTPNQTTKTLKPGLSPSPISGQIQPPITPIVPTIAPSVAELFPDTAMQPDTPTVSMDQSALESEPKSAQEPAVSTDASAASPTTTEIPVITEAIKDAPQNAAQTADAAPSAPAAPESTTPSEAMPNAPQHTAQTADAAPSAPAAPESTVPSEAMPNAPQSAAQTAEAAPSVPAAPESTVPSEAMPNAPQSAAQTANAVPNPFGTAPETIQPQTPMQPPIAPVKRFCTACGKKLTPGSHFCSGCGKPM